MRSTVVRAQELHWAAGRARYKLRTTSGALMSGVILRLFYRSGFAADAGPPSADAARAMRRRLFALMDRDLSNAEHGYYPRDLLFELPIRRYLRQLPDLLSDARRITERRHARAFDDLPADVDRERFPRYYLRNFHWQTDGWLSARSARLYDPSVELLFGGTADIMRRMAIPPLIDGLRGKRQPRVLDVGAGTGRFLRALGRARPDAVMTALDLSEFYLAEAEALLARRGRLTTVVGAAEAMPFADESFDALSSIFLFHELPRAVRREVASEMFRVLRPGGVLSVCDSAQLVESSEIGFFLERFPETYHEPFYREYLRDDLARVFAEAGFEILRTEPHAVSKVVAARRPA